MSIVIITGSSGLIGSESVSFFCQKGFKVIAFDESKNKINKYKNLNIDKIKFETRSEIDEVLFAYSFAIDHNYSNEEFIRMLDKFFGN